MRSFHTATLPVRLAEADMACSPTGKAQADPAGHCRFKGAGGGGALRIFTPRIAVSGARVSFLTNLSSRRYAIRSR
jgi:hypothetical protein